MIKPGRLWIVLFLLPALVMFLLVYLGPLVTAAVTKWNGVQAPRFIGFANYLRLAGNAQFQAAFGNTIKGVLAAAFIHVPFGVLVALVLFKRPRGWACTTTKAALILVYTGFSMPLCLFVLRSYMMHLPFEMEESAYLEGASVPRTFWQFMLPLTQPALVSSAVLTFLGSWNELLYALLLTSSEHNRTLPLAMRYFMQQFTFDFSAMFAALVIYVVPSIILYIVLQEQIMSGIAPGAINE